MFYRVLDFTMAIFLLLELFVLITAASSVPVPQLPPPGQSQVTEAPKPATFIFYYIRLCGDDCNADEDDGGCKCDVDCDAYGDCCGDSATRLPEACDCAAHTPNKNLKGLQFTCQSIFLDSEIEVMQGEAFWMVSSCSVDWIEEVGESGKAVLEECISQVRDLPPVTDTVTGVVYKNQHCAVCNGVESPIPWSVSVSCTSYIYKLLEEKFISEVSAQLIREQCKVCSFQPPKNTRRPRACFPTIDTCLDSTDEGVLQFASSPESYATLVSECVNGSYSPRVCSSTPGIYRNFDCLKCNGWCKTYWEFPDTRGEGEFPNQCIPDVDPPTQSYSTTSTPPSDATVTDVNSSNGGSTSGEDTMTGSGSGEMETSISIETVTDEFPTILVGVGVTPAFTITLQSFGRESVLIIEQETELVRLNIDCPEGQAMVGLECRDTLCPENSVSVDGRCQSLQPNNLFKTSKLPNSSKGTNESKDDLFIVYPTELVSLNHTEYIQLSNNTALVDGMEVEVLGYSEDGQPLICLGNFTLIEINTTLYFYPVGFIELTYVGCSLSVIGSALVHC